MDSNDFDDLTEAVGLLENPGLPAKLSNLVGGPLEKAIEKTPEQMRKIIQSSTEKAISMSLNIACKTMDGGPKVERPSNLFHRVLSATSGGVGGYFGMLALPLELPISTTIIMRSILDIARSEGEDIQQAETKMACLVVFALGGRSAGDNGVDSAYFAVRAALAKAVSEAVEYLTVHGLSRNGAPALVRLVTYIAGRFGVQVTEKFAAQSVPIIGAAGGAAINVLFLNHFQDMACGHFIVRRLERKYGKEVVEENYRRILGPTT